MKHIIMILLALSVLSFANVAAAKPDEGDRAGRGEPTCGHPGQPPCDRTGPRGDGRRGDDQRDDGRRGDGQRNDGPRADGPRWSRGDRMPRDYRDDRFHVPDWRQNNLPRPPRGYRWMCYERGNCFLVSDRTGIIRDARWRGDREHRWRERYTQTYTYVDDVYYRECRSRPDPAGILIGGIIGGLLGRAAGDDSAGATIAGIIIGGAIGGALTRDMDCDDRGYAYGAFYQGLNGGRAGVVYRWRNPHNRHYGEFRVRSYYDDSYGFHCANYHHVAFIDRRREAAGRACRQPDGAWAFLN